MLAYSNFGGALGAVDLTGGGMNDQLYFDVLGIGFVEGAFDGTSPGQVGFSLFLESDSNGFDPFTGVLIGEGRVSFSFDEIAAQAETEGGPTLDFSQIDLILVEFDLSTPSTDTFVFAGITEIGADRAAAVPLPAPLLMLGGALAALGLIGGAGRPLRRPRGWT